jgi:sarcosine oxidase subunit beta
MSFVGDYYIQQRPNGTIIAGSGPGGYEKAAHNPEDMGNSWGFLERTAQILSKVLPRTRELGITHQWSGMYDLTPDLQPCIGETDEVKGLWLNVSGCRGFMFGPVAGELVAQMIIKGKSDLDISEFHWRRYAQGKKFKDLMVV